MEQGTLVTAPHSQGFENGFIATRTISKSERRSQKAYPYEHRWVMPGQVVEVVSFTKNLALVKFPDGLIFEVQATHRMIHV